MHFLELMEARSRRLGVRTTDLLSFVPYCIIPNRIIFRAIALPLYLESFQIMLGCTLLCWLMALGLSARGYIVGCIVCRQGVHV